METRKNPIIVSYPWGNYPLPNSNVCYTRIVISASEPKMPGKLPESDDDETAPSEETNDSFNLRDVTTWNTYITQGPLGIEILKQRLRTALDLPSRMSPQLQALWDILCAWIDDSAERGGREQRRRQSQKTSAKAQLTRYAFCKEYIEEQMLDIYAHNTLPRKTHRTDLVM